MSSSPRQLLDDPGRCVHIGDRESDIYELFCAAQEVGTHFLVRTCVDRLAGDGDHTIADEMDEAAIKGLHRIEVQRRQRRSGRSRSRDQVSQDSGLAADREAEALSRADFDGDSCRGARHAEKQKENRVEADHRSSCSLPRRTPSRSCRWYALRWKIEVFHKILKSGCKAEESKLRTAQRLANLIAVFCILSWRVFWMTMLNRSAPDAPPNLALTATEIAVLDHLVKDKTDKRDEKPSPTI